MPRAQQVVPRPLSRRLPCVVDMRSANSGVRDWDWDWDSVVLCITTTQQEVYSTLVSACVRGMAGLAWLGASRGEVKGRRAVQG